ncbi:MAG: hypothetical protein HKN24_10945, partial [Acidimicrobiales bacterium]|nr:hypothetical protein [Acidimicrobiales bacterium]
FTAKRETNEVTVIAHGTDPESYNRLRSSEEFGKIVGQFASRFTRPAEVSINEILVEM